MADIVCCYAEPSEYEKIEFFSRSVFSATEAVTIDEDFLSHGFVVSASRNGDFCGYIAFSVAADECEIRSIAVYTEKRQSGVGTALLGFCEKEIGKKGVGTVFLEVREDNRAAISFYEKSGFSECGRRKKYYSAPVSDAIIMKKELK